MDFGFGSEIENLICSWIIQNHPHPFPSGCISCYFESDDPLKRYKAVISCGGTKFVELKAERKLVRGSGQMEQALREQR